MSRRVSRAADLLLETRVGARPIGGEVGAMDQEQCCSAHGLWLENAHLSCSKYRPGVGQRDPWREGSARSLIEPEPPGVERFRLELGAELLHARRDVALEDVLDHTDLAIVVKRHVDMRARHEIDRDLPADRAAHREADAVT